MVLLALAGVPGQPATASCKVEWRDGQLVVRADREIQVKTSTMREPERRILDLLGADLAPGVPSLIPVDSGGIRQIRVARHPESGQVRVVLDLDAGGALRTDVLDGGRTHVARLAWAPPPQVAAGPPGPTRTDRAVSPPIPNRSDRPVSSPIPTGNVPPIGPPVPVVASEEATRSAPWPSAPQIVESMRIRLLYSGATVVEIRGKSKLMAWVQDEVSPRRLTIRVPRALLECAAPRARGAVERVKLAREPESWALAVELGAGEHVVDSSPSPDGKGLTLRIEKARPLDPAKPVVLVDAGHGGYDPGALGRGGKTESEVALAVARHLARDLAAEGFQPVLTRTFDAELRLGDRELLIARHDPVAVVSLHCNSSETPDAAGIETYFRHEPGRNLARAVQEQLVHVTRSNDRGVRSANLYVLRHERIPSALVEMGFISSPDEEARLTDPAYQRLLARAVASGVRKFSEERKLATLPAEPSPPLPLSPPER